MCVEKKSAFIAEVLNSEYGYQRCLKWDTSLL